MRIEPKSFAIIPILLFAIVSKGQSCDMTSIEEDLHSPSKVITCDFNGDGFEDIVFLDINSNSVFWKENTGSDEFGPAVELAGGAPMKFLTSCDLNDDDNDEIIISTVSTVYYILYTGGDSFDFDELYTIPDFYVMDALAIGDFDNDGSDGLALGYSRASTLNAKLDIIKNDDGSLSVENLFDATIGPITDLAIGDISGNNKVDIAMAGYSNYWFENLGGAIFLEEQVISSASSDWGRIAIMDYDKDEDVELVVLDESGNLIAYGIDLTGEGWVYDPINILSGLPGNPQTWEHTRFNGRDVLLLSGADEIIGLENPGTTFTEVSYCSGISDLNGVTLFDREDGYIEFVLSRESEGTIEKINEAVTNDIEDLVLISFEIYPNPANEYINVVFNNEASIRDVKVMNTLGQTIEINNIGGYQYDVQQLSQGLYQLIVTDKDGGVFTKSFVKSN